MANRTHKKRPRDPNQLGKMIVDISVGDAEDSPPAPDPNGKDPAAVSLGRRGGLKGGRARADNLSSQKRSEIARRAANARWRKSD